MYLNRYAPATESDVAIVKEQLGRTPRGMLAIAARANSNDPLKVPDGTPLVVLTAPRVPDPFPTLFYLTNPTYTSAISRLEAAGLMKAYSEILDPNSETYNSILAEQFKKDHQRYIKLRDDLARELEIEPLTSTHADFSAGGMPTRVKCLHALIGHHLADPLGNAIGSLALNSALKA